MVVAPKCPGDVVVIDELPRAGLVLVQGAFLAAASTITVESRVQRNMFNSALSGTGLFTLHLSGQGPVAFGGVCSHLGVSPWFPVSHAIPCGP